MDLVAIGGLALLALIDSTSIGTLVLPILMLAQAHVRPARVLVYLLTIGAFYFALGLALLAGAEALRPALEDAGDLLQAPGVRVGLPLAAGIALIALSFRWTSKAVARREARRGGRPTRIQTLRARLIGPEATVGGTIALGVAAAGIEAASMLPYLGAIGIIAAAELTTSAAVLVLAGYVLVMVVPALALLIGRLAARAHLDRRLARLEAWLVRNTAGAVGWTVFIVGVLAIYVSIEELVPILS